MWPRTAGAAVWLTEYASKWWKPTSTMYRWAQAYALVNGRCEGAFLSLDTKWRARAAILKTVLLFGCHIGEMNAAIDRAYGVDPYHVEPKVTKHDEQEDVDFAALVARLEVSSGISVDQWLWGRSLVSMMKSYRELSALAKAALGGEKANAQMELDEAVANLARICAKIGERLRERNEESN
jgi:hypothetical protein